MPNPFTAEPVSFFPKVEDELKKQIQSATGKTVIGVSVGWDVGDKYEDFEAAMGFQISELEHPG